MMSDDKDFIKKIIKQSYNHIGLFKYKNNEFIDYGLTKFGREGILESCGITYTYLEVKRYFVDIDKFMETGRVYIYTTHNMTKDIKKIVMREIQYLIKLKDIIEKENIKKLKDMIKK